MSDRDVLILTFKLRWAFLPIQGNACGLWRSDEGKQCGRFVFSKKYMKLLCSSIKIILLLEKLMMLMYYAGINSHSLLKREAERRKFKYLTKKLNLNASKIVGSMPIAALALSTWNQTVWGVLGRFMESKYLKYTGNKKGLCSYFSILYLNLDINRINYWLVPK